MKKTKLIFVFLLLFVMVKAQDVNSFKTYQLKNGLTVILDSDPSQTQVFGMVAVNVGSKDEELNATGLAHYLEHMLFKGTETLGTSNWEKEKPLIEKTYALYDKLQLAKTEEEVKQINKEINDVSQEASKYAIPNELTKLVEQMGGVGLNASTSFDITEYHNAFPPNQLEPWLDLYAHRFENPVFRLFQTELETVYEEKNRAEDNPNNAYSNALMTAIFGTHPYSRPIIGYTEHLKKPWMSKMREFFEKWYVPENMALILSGNFDIDEAEKLIATKFEKWQSKKIPERVHQEIKPFKGVEKVKVKLSPFQRAEIIYRGMKNDYSDELTLDVLSQILSNAAQTGLLDKLSLSGEAMFVNANHMTLKDGSILGISFAPVFDVNQRRQMSFKSVETLIDVELNKLKTGDYEDWLLSQVKNDMLKSYKLLQERPASRAFAFSDIFIKGKDPKEFFDYEKELAKIDKNKIGEIAKKYLTKDYLAFYSSKGEGKKEKIEKPKLDPIKPIEHQPSVYADYFLTIPTTKVDRKFVDINNDVNSDVFQDKINLHYVNNKRNDVFSMNILFHVGLQTIPMLKYAIELINNAGVMAQYKPEELRKEFGKIGVTYHFSVNDDYTIINMQGNEKVLGQACQLITRLMLLPKIEDKALDRIIGMEYQDRMIGKNMLQVQEDALREFIKYNKKSEYIDRISLTNLISTSPSTLNGKLSEAFSYNADIHYYGQKPLNEVKEILKNNLAFASNRKQGNSPVYREKQKYTENTIYLINNSNSSQSKIFIFMNGTPVPIEKIPVVNAFNHYFSGGFTGLMMKEVREYRSLAYGANAYVSLPQIASWNSDLYGSIGTQGDKTVEAIAVVTELLKNMPEYPDRAENIKKYLINSSYMDRPSDRRLSYSIYNWKKKGYKEDPVKINLPIYENISFDNILTFYKNHIQNKPYVIGIVGPTKKIDTKKLKEYGKVIKLSGQKIFSKE